MPRASTVKTEETSVAPKKRAPRKRVVSVDGAEEKTPTRRPRRRKTTENDNLIKEAKEAKEVSISDSSKSDSQTRRAPTPLREQKMSSRKFTKTLLVGLVLFTLLSGVGVAIGVSDNGVIDVVAVVNERNERINRGEVREGESTISVPVQNTDVRPNGGLIAADTNSLPAPVPTDIASTSIENSSTNASSTTETVDSLSDFATTTSESVVEEGVNENETPVTQ